MKPKTHFVSLRLGILLAVGATALTAQSTGPDATCTTPPSGVSSFLMEHVVDVTTIKSTFTPSLPADVVTQIFSGAKEVRSRIAYNQATKILTNDLFLVDPGSPDPSPSSLDIVKVRFGYIVVTVDKVYTSCRPRPSVSLVGVIDDGYPVFGNPTGAPYTFSFGYTLDATPSFRDIVSDAGGLALVYAEHAPGSISFQTLNAAIAGGPIVVTKSPMVTLNASGTTGALTYTWSSPFWGLAFIDQGMPSTRVWIGAGAGDYLVNLTVRNADGDQSTTTVTIRYQP